MLIIAVIPEKGLSEMPVGGMDYFNDIVSCFVCKFIKMSLLTHENGINSASIWNYLQNLLSIFALSINETERMNWLQEAFLEPTMVQAVIIISLVSALGLYLGRIKIFGISLGITFVFFCRYLSGTLRDRRE